MNSLVRFLCCFLAFVGSFTPFYAGQVKDVFVGDLRFWTESFGDKTAPALLLVSGGGTQAIMWPDLFCEQLERAGFFVIRYDLRDMGLSSSIDYANNAYDLLDFAKDAIGILDAYGIDKAHVLGASMGGSIVMLLGAHFPERIKTITPMIATTDLSTILNPTHPHSFLPSPTQGYLNWLDEALHALGESHPKEERISIFLKGWRILNGTDTPFDEALYTHIVTATMDRMQNPTGVVNHICAMKASLELLNAAYPKIKVPVLLIQGTADPIFSIEHGEALAKSIPGSKLVVMQGMGHNLNPFFYDALVSAIKSHVQIRESGTL